MIQSENDYLNNEAQRLDPIYKCFEITEEDRLAELQYFEYDMPKFWDNIDWELYEQIKFAKKIKA